MRKSDLILKGSVSKAVLLLALPIMANNLIQTFYNLTDTYFVSKLGTTQMAAMQFIFSLVFFMMSIGMGLSIGGLALISQYVGSGNKNDAKKTAGQLLTLALIASLVVGSLGALLSRNIVSLMGAEGDLLNYASTYLRIMFLGAPTMFITFAFNGIKQGEGDTLTPMILSGLSVVLNIILDPIFIFVLDLGIAGAAYATVLSRGIFNVISLFILFGPKHNTLGIEKNDLKLNSQYFVPIIKIGFPAALGQSMTSLGFTVLNVFILSFGEAILTAFAIGNRISSIIFMPAMGISGALTTIVGQNIGADNYKRANEAFLKSVGIASAIMVVGAVIMFMFTDQLIGVFSDDPYIIEEGSFYLKMILITIPLFGFFNCLTGLFQGSGHTVSAMVLNVGRLWGLRVPMLMLIQMYNINNPDYIWYAMIISNTVICFIGLLMYLSGRWKSPVIKKRKFA
ncbi:MATE family efflux transporter [Acidaminobacter sp. JC074]|uniref:MATE family efflux transporter n=1 Tax=Acidaminobacter sp. JC074 TaxID=2530199 RepID=UPI001F101FBB|nr:MATE family efflux transporter [Acidaminobacter sp. JC074]MCH4890024.1 MATE family efflux transporter [Acidaminobacter sp. JC074]